MIEFTLPWPPSVNRMWRNVGPRTLLSRKGRDYRTAALAYVLDQRVPRQKLKNRLSVEIIAYPPDRRARDLDNLLKGILDALQCCEVIENDSCIDWLSIERGPVGRSGKVLVRVQAREAA